ncbi:MAG: hypothetical protein WBA77_21585 [Microcoleaceae cyanobacterium]
MSFFSTAIQPCQYLKQNIVNMIAVAAGVAVSVGIWNTLPTSPTQYHFQQQIGTDTLSGSFEASDRNSDGVIELSEVKTFQATWKNHTWSKENLEAFIWGQKTTQSYQDKQHQFNGLNLFARTRHNQTSQILQIQNTGISTPQQSVQNVGVWGLEYSNNQSETVLFSQPTLKLDVIQTQANQYLEPTKVSVCLALVGLLLWKPLVPSLVLNKKAFQV